MLGSFDELMLVVVRLLLFVMTKPSGQGISPAAYTSGTRREAVEQQPLLVRHAREDEDPIGERRDEQHDPVDGDQTSVRISRGQGPYIWNSERSRRDPCRRRGDPYGCRAPDFSSTLTSAQRGTLFVHPWAYIGEEGCDYRRCVRTKVSHFGTFFDSS